MANNEYSSTSAVPYQPIVESQSLSTNQSVDCNVLVQTNSTPPLKYYKTLRILAIIELVIAILTIVLGVVSFGTSAVKTTADDALFDFDFSGVWLGILYTIACFLGVGGLQNPSGYRCPITAYFVLLIICIVLTPTLLSFSMAWSVISNSYCNADWVTNPAVYCFLSATNAILFIINLVESKQSRGSVFQKYMYIII